MSLSDKDSFFANPTRSNNNSFQRSPLIDLETEKEGVGASDNIRKEIEREYALNFEEVKRKLELDARNKLAIETARIKEETEKYKSELENKMRNLEISNESGDNKGHQLQKFRKYPERKFDKLVSKILYIEPETLQLCRDIAVEISLARKTLDLDKNNPLPRFSENTVIRAAVKAILHSEKIANIDLRTIQTESALEDFFRSLLKK